MFIDTSALVAVLLSEPGHEAIEKVIYGAKEPKRYSPCVRLEATLASAKAKFPSGPCSRNDLRKCAESVDITLRSIGAIEIDVTPAVGAAAIEAAATYGKFVGRKA